MLQPRVSALILPFSLLLLLAPYRTFAASQENARVALHVKAPTFKTGSICGSWAPATTPCSQYNTQGLAGTEQCVYLVVGNASRAGILSATFGIDYNGDVGQGIDVQNWIPCGPTFIRFGEWPDAKTGIGMFWNTCQNNWVEPNGTQVVVGALTVYAYGADTLRVTPNPVLKVSDGCTDQTHAISFVDCAGLESDVFSGPLAFAVFSPSGQSPGYNPCPDSASPYPTVNTDHAIFTECVPGTTSLETMRITNWGTGPLYGEASTFGDDYSIVSGGGSYTLQSGEFREIQARFSPAQTGISRGQLSFGPGTLYIDLWGVGVCAIESGLVISPTTLDFGSIAVGTGKELLLHVANPADCSPAIFSQRFSAESRKGGGVFTSCNISLPLVIEPHGFVDIPILFSPLSPSVYNTSLDVESSAKLNAGFIPLLGYAICPSLICLVEPDRLDFGRVLAGESVERSFRLTNDSMSCDILHVTISENSEDLQILSGGGTYLLIPGGSQLVTVRFAPVADGLRVGTVEISSNATSGCSSVEVTGTRLTPVDASEAWLEPGTLNAASQSPWLKAVIELPDPYVPEQIEVSTVSAFDSIPADPAFFEIADGDQDGRREASVRFSRSAILRNISSIADSLIVPIRGDLDAVAIFSAHPVLRVVRPHLSRPRSGDVLIAGTFQSVLLEIPPSWQVDHVEISYSLNAGNTWSVPLRANGNEYVWRVPETETNQGLIRAEVYDTFGFLGGDACDGPFTISRSVAVADVNPSAVWLRNSPNPFAASTAIRFSVDRDVRMDLVILDVQGHVVRRLADGWVTAGEHEIAWDSRDEAGRLVSTGVYLCHLSGPQLDRTQRILKLGP